MNYADQIIKYYIVHHLTGEYFKGSPRAYDRVTDCKSSYKQQTKHRENLYRGYKFDEQTEYVIERRTYEMVKKEVL